MGNFPSITDLILAILFGGVLPIVSGLQSRVLFRERRLEFTGPMKIRFYLNNSLVLFLGAGLVALNWILHGREISRLGVGLINRAEIKPLSFLILLFFLLYGLDLWATFGNRPQRPNLIRETAAQAPFLPLHRNEFPAYFIMCLTAALCEEWIYRGYLITLFQALFNGAPGASAFGLLIPSILFSAAHYYQGLKAVFKILVLSTLFGIIFLKSGSLLIVCLLHFLVDWCSGLFYAHFAEIDIPTER